MATKKKRSVVITISGDRPIKEVARDLKAAGFEVGQVLDTIGSLTGSADPAKLKKLRGVRGVASVDEDQPVDIGPPGSIS